MSENKPSIYANCKAGCSWETVHKDDFLRSASHIRQSMSEDGRYYLEKGKEYKIFVQKGASVFAVKFDYTHSTAGSQVYVIERANGDAYADSFTFKLLDITYDTSRNSIALVYDFAGIRKTEWIADLSSTWIEGKCLYVEGVEKVLLHNSDAEIVATETVAKTIILKPTEGLSYALSSVAGADGTASYEFYTCRGIGSATSKDIVIASEYNGLPVLGVKAAAFEGADITSVVIADSIENIGLAAFKNCTSLGYVAIGRGVTKIKSFEGLDEEDPFYGCDNLTTVVNNSLCNIKAGDYGIPTTAKVIKPAYTEGAIADGNLAVWSEEKQAFVDGGKGKGIIYVYDLPTENINENVFYRTQYRGAFLQNGKILGVSGDISNGKKINLWVVDELPEIGKTYYSEDNTVVTYYIQMKDSTAYVYRDAYGWQTIEELGGSSGYGGVVYSIDEATDPELQYYLVEEYHKLFYYKDGWHEVVDEDRVEKISRKVDDLYSVLEQEETITVTETEDAYTERETAGGLNIYDGVQTSVKTIQGATVRDTATDTLKNAYFKGIKSTGKNLFDFEGLSFRYVENIEYKVFSAYVAAGKYTFSTDNDDICVVQLRLDGTVLGMNSQISYETPRTATVANDGILSFMLRREDKQNFIGTEKIQLEYGETKTAYEPYKEDRLELPTPVELAEGDTLYPAENKVIRADGRAETVIFNKSSYTAWRDGSETVEQGETDNSAYGAECTITQEYLTKMGG